MLPITLLICLLIYAMSLLCVEVIMRDASAFEAYNDFDPHEYFGTLPKAWLTLFNMVILDEWSCIIRPISKELAYMTFPLCMFMILCSYAIMNVVIGIICQHTQEAAERNRQESNAQRR